MSTGLSGIVGGIYTGNKAASAGRQAAAAANRQISESKVQALDRIDPYADYGSQAMMPLSALIYGKNYNPETGEFSDISEGERMAQFTESPGYQFRLNEGLKAIERRNAATGVLLGGNTQKELMSYGQNLASDEYGNYINNLMAQLAIGQNADTNAANVITGAGTQMAGYQYAGGMMNAQKYANLSNALFQSSGFGGGGAGAPPSSSFSGAGSQNMSPGMQAAAGIGAFLSDISLKENIEMVGNDKGFNIYEFNYKGQPERYRGVMAQEVQDIMPEAIVEKDGFLAVDYKKIGVEFKQIGYGQ